MKARHSVVNPIAGGVAMLSLESGWTHGSKVCLKWLNQNTLGILCLLSVNSCYVDISKTLDYNVFCSVWLEPSYFSFDVVITYYSPLHFITLSRTALNVARGRVS